MLHGRSRRPRRGSMPPGRDRPHVDGVCRAWWPIRSLGNRARLRLTETYAQARLETNAYGSAKKSVDDLHCILLIFIDEFAKSGVREDEFQWVSVPSGKGRDDSYREPLAVFQQSGCRPRQPPENTNLVLVHPV